MKHNAVIGWANWLTIGRILIIPPLVILMFFGDNAIRWLCLVLYTIACVTDYFDGFLARYWDETTSLGRFLDPIADKLLVAALLIQMVADQRIQGFHSLAALVIMMREIAVSGLREHLAGVKVRVPVSRLAKWKTGLQMFSLGFLIIGDGYHGWFNAKLIGEIFLWLAAIATCYTGYEYLKAGVKNLTEND